MFDSLGGSFVCHLAPRSLGYGQTSWRAAEASREVCEALDCDVMHSYGTRGFIAHESSGVQSFSTESEVIVFLGQITNREELAGRYELRPDIPPAELVHALYEMCDCSFLSELEGFFSFCVLDATTAQVFAANDRHGSIPLYKVRRATK